MKRLFGTDGIRGVANREPMTTEMAMKIGRGTALIFRQMARDKHRTRIVIGKDTRISGYMLENALVAGICSMGAHCLLVGPLPTPGIAFITRNMRADAGVVISASHNPYQDNGIKIFSSDGFKLPDFMEERIEDLIFSGDLDLYRPGPEGIGTAYRIEDNVGRYIVFLKNTFPKNLTLEGMKIVVDCANGAAYKVAPSVFDELGAEVFPISVKPDGRNINKNCGSLYPEAISKAVKEYGADMGLALDGDGDRVVFCDENGEVINGDRIIAACALDLKEQNLLKRDTVVVTIMSNIGLEKFLKERGIDLVRTPVGDRYVVEKMVEGGYNLGGEQSGHLIFLDHNTTGDGILCSLQVLSIMIRKGKRLSEFASDMVLYPQVMINVKAHNRVDLEGIPLVQREIDQAKRMLGDNGRILIRYSGTEPLLRIMVEGEREDQIRSIAEGIADTVAKFL
jgi:phosphoglucosamine mutase